MSDSEQLSLAKIRLRAALKQLEHACELAANKAPPAPQGDLLSAMDIEIEAMKELQTENKDLIQKYTDQKKQLDRYKYSLSKLDDSVAHLIKDIEKQLRSA